MASPQRTTLPVMAHYFRTTDSDTPSRWSAAKLIVEILVVQ